MAVLPAYENGKIVVELFNVNEGTVQKVASAIEKTVDTIVAAEKVKFHQGWSIDMNVICDVLKRTLDKVA